MFSLVVTDLLSYPNSRDAITFKKKLREDFKKTAKGMTLVISL